MKFRTKLQIFGLPLIVIPLIVTATVYSLFVSRTITETKKELLSAQLNLLSNRITASQEVLSKVGFQDNEFFIKNALDSISINFSKLLGPGESFIIFSEQGEYLKGSIDATGNILAKTDPLQAAINPSAGMLVVSSPFLPRPTARHLVAHGRFEPWGWYLVVAADEETIYSSLRRATLVSLVISALSIILATLGFFLISARISEPLARLTNIARKMGEGTLDIRTGIQENDEIGLLASEFDSMAGRISSLNKGLEKTVHERTSALQESNAELSKTITELRILQNQMIQQEKMAALGGMVAGISHEINTPIGNCITAASFLEDSVKDLEIKFNDRTLDTESMGNFIAQCKEVAQITLLSLRHASELVSSFKKVAVDQELDDMSLFDIGEYIANILVSLRPSFKKTKIAITTDLPENLVIESYPSAFIQIISNLVMNSLIHAYTPTSAGMIAIKVLKEDSFLTLDYSDDGLGMDTETARRIFDPFFTTTRGRGGVGLGMHIVYNIVTLKLNGKIFVKSEPGKGMNCIIRIPLKP